MRKKSISTKVTKYFPSDEYFSPTKIFLDEVFPDKVYLNFFLLEGCFCTTHERQKINILCADFYEWKTNLKKFVWWKFMLVIRGLRKSNNLEIFYACQPQNANAIKCYTRWNQLYFSTMVLTKRSCFIVFPEVFFSSF